MRKPSNRAAILADTLARLEAERYTPTPTWGQTEMRRRTEPLPDWTAAEQAEHRAILEDALSDDLHVVAWREGAA